MMYENVQYFRLIKKEHVIPSQQGRIDYMLTYEKKTQNGEKLLDGVGWERPYILDLENHVCNVC